MLELCLKLLEKCTNAQVESISEYFVHLQRTLSDAKVCVNQNLHRHIEPSNSMGQTTIQRFKLTEHGCRVLEKDRELCSVLV